MEDMREEQGVRKYLVKWKGHRERTWNKAQDHTRVR